MKFNSLNIYSILNYFLLLEIFTLTNAYSQLNPLKNSINQSSNIPSNIQMYERIHFHSNNSLIRPPQRNLRKRDIFANNQNNLLDECCETVVETYKPLGGVSRHGKILILYRDNDLVQTFYQLSCKKDILNKPCKFLDKQYESRSVCTQRYSYTLALVRDPDTSEDLPYRLDNIRIKNGCVCGIKL